ncbi:carbohydrate ABC transporter permease [candidate division KSB1 bacterium]|nr:carbohydrate ABC transporter permease [candidate division KSB1 bacterium]
MPYFVFNDRVLPRLPSLGWYTMAIFLSLVFLTPFVWMLSSSVQSLESIFAVPFRWLPATWHWENYRAALLLLPFFRFFLNTSLIGGLSMVGTLISSSLVAFGFARIRFRGRNALFSICLITLMLPGQITMIPLYVIFAKLGWIDTYLPLIVPSFLGSPFYIFLLRQFFLTLPFELDEAAWLDGANRWQIYWRIILPLARPALATVLVLHFIGVWNDFFNPLIYLNSFEKATLTLGLNLMKAQIIGTGVTQWHLLMAASVMILLPNILIFFLAQRYFMQGMQIGSLKG